MSDGGSGKQRGGAVNRRRRRGAPRAARSQDRRAFRAPRRPRFPGPPPVSRAGASRPSARGAGRAHKITRREHDWRPGELARVGRAEAGQRRLRALRAACLRLQFDGGVPAHTKKRHGSLRRHLHSLGLLLGPAARRRRKSLAQLGAALLGCEPSAMATPERARRGLSGGVRFPAAATVQPGGRRSLRVERRRPLTRNVAKPPAEVASFRRRSTDAAH